MNIKELDLDELVVRTQSNLDDGASFTEICRRFTGLVLKYARQDHLASVRDEAISVGWLAVVEAIRSYDPLIGVRFAGYVDSRVKYAIWNFFKKQRRRWQVEVPEISSCEGDKYSIFDVREDVYVIDDIAEYVADKVDKENAWLKVREDFSRLSSKQQMAIKGVVVGDYTLKQVAGQMGVTPQAVFNLQKRGLGKLRDELISFGA